MRVAALSAAMLWTGSALACPMETATYLLDSDPETQLTFESAEGEPHGWSILGLYAILHRGGVALRYSFGGATNGDLLITGGFEAAIVADPLDDDGAVTADDYHEQAAPRLLTRDAAGPIEVPEGIWVLRCP